MTKTWFVEVNTRQIKCTIKSAHMAERNLESLSERGSSKLYKACRRCVKGNSSAVVGEVGKALSRGFVFIDAYIIILA